MGSNTNTIKTCLEWQATKALICIEITIAINGQVIERTKDIGLLRVNINKHLVFSKHTLLSRLNTPGVYSNIGRFDPAFNQGTAFN